MDEIDKILKELNEKREEYKNKYGNGLIQIQVEESKLVEKYKGISLDYMSLYPRFMKFNIRPDNINIKRKEKIDKMRNPNQI